MFPTDSTKISAMKKVEGILDAIQFRIYCNPVCYVWTCIKGKQETGGVSEQIASNNIWTQEGGSNRRLEKFS
jgi:hypothetical protein